MIRVGIIGCGRIADLHVQTYLTSPETSIVALCDTNLRNAEDAASRWGIDRVSVYRKYEDLLVRDDIEAVEILVPHHFHSSIAIAAAKAGKNIAMQKPIGRTLQEADAIIGAAEQCGVMLKVYENFLFYPPVLTAANLIQRGDIGIPLSIHLKSNSGNPVFGWPVPSAARAWRFDRSLSGGGSLTFDDGHHKIAIAQFLMGDVVGVQARVHQTIVRDDQILDAPAAIIFEFDNSRLGTWDVVYSPKLKVITRQYAQYDPVEITGTEGIIWINCGHGYTRYQAPIVMYRDGKSTHYDDLPSEWSSSFQAAVQNTIDALLGRSSPSLTGHGARRILEIALGISVSASDQRFVLLNPSAMPTGENLIF